MHTHTLSFFLFLSHTHFLKQFFSLFFCFFVMSLYFLNLCLHFLSFSLLYVYLYFSLFLSDTHKHTHTHTLSLSLSFSMTHIHILNFGMSVFTRVQFSIYRLVWSSRDHFRYPYSRFSCRDCSNSKKSVRNGMINEAKKSWFFFPTQIYL